MTIRRRFARAMGVAVAASFLVAFLMSILISREVLYNVLAEGRRAVAQSIAACAEGVLGGDPQSAVPRALEAAKGYPAVAYAYVSGPDERIAWHSEPAMRGVPLSEWRLTRPATEHDELRVPARIGGGAGVVALASPFLLKDMLFLMFIQMFGKLYVVIGVVLLGAALLVAALMARRFTRPIEELAEASKRLGRGDFTAKLPVHDSDELGELAMRFNSMTVELKTLDELKDAFVATVSHDLRNPMAAVHMYAQYMLKEDPDRGTLTPGQREKLEIMMDNVMRLNVFTTNILDSAKIKSGRMEYVLEPVDLSAAAQRVLGLFAMLARHRKIELSLDAAVPGPRALADGERLQQAVSNLVSNALKFTRPGGRVTVAVRPAGSRAVVEVRDTGKGMTAEEVGRLFQRFQQADVAGQKRELVQGTGLGLYIVKQTVDAMSGSIEVESAPEKGSLFRISLPLAGGAA
ncbi:MAG: HAMP domain-containing histidine kinase [Elusimicrobia bacterium]|nr:HAMP domain-containing histidine kinase [Elusimicrobiota bacterium]